MSIPAAFPQLGEPIGALPDGTPVMATEATLRLLESLFLRTGGDEDAVFAQTQASARAAGIAIGIRDGTQVIADPSIAGEGRLSARLAAIEANVDATASQGSASTGALTASASPKSAFGAGDGSVTTNAVTVTAAGGAGSETYAWSVMDARVSATSPSSATVSFGATIGFNEEISTQAACTVTDMDGATYTVLVSVFLASDPESAI